MKMNITQIKPLTDIQRATLDFIVSAMIRDYCPPTFREMCKEFGIRLQAVHDRLTSLERKGYIVQLEKVSHPIRLTDKAKQEYNLDPVISNNNAITLKTEIQEYLDSGDTPRAFVLNSWIEMFKR